MLDEYQTAESHGLTLEGPYAFPEAGTQGTRRRRSRVPAELFRYRIVKRGIDVLFVLLATPILVPLLLAVAFAVKVTSPGPALFSHRRIRRNGAFFSMWKFRTMCADSTEVLEQYLARHPEARTEWNKTHKLRFDPRVTPVGLLDELPQVWNVLTGKMSLVGPRPIVAAEVEKYKDSFDCYCRVKPGLTGLWQVSGRSELTYDQRVALDCMYVKHWTLLGDFKILLKTFPSVVNQDGAF
jgi:lipopolysaccharide/colanic/teichoic acid biosynthesis glycosyltransferase